VAAPRRSLARIPRHGFAETYTGLQTGGGRRPGQSLPKRSGGQFYEVLSQIVLTSHLIGYDLLTVNLRPGMGCRREAEDFQAGPDKAIAWSTAEH